jgi:cell wall-associated NlpC family hydrolase
MRSYGPASSVGGASSGGIWLLVVVAFLLGPHLGPALATTFPQGPPNATRPSSPHGDGRVARASAKTAVAFALRQRGRPYRWAAEGPHAFDCSGLTWAAWRAAGRVIPRTAAGQLAGLPRVRGRLRPGDLVIYRTNGPSRRHVAMVVSPERMVEARGHGIPVRVTSLRRGWLGVVRPGGR